MNNNDNSIRVQADQKLTKVFLEGWLDSQLAEQLITMTPKLKLPVIFDFAGLNHCSEHGSRAILQFYQHHQQRPAILNANADIRSLFKLTGTDRFVVFAKEKNAPVTERV